MQEIPGSALNSTIPLQFIWILDQSDSMHGDKIQALNTAIRESLPLIVKATEENPSAEVFMRALSFSNEARWHIAEPTPIKDVQWTDLIAGGSAAIGRALKMVADAMKVTEMPERGLPPVVVLVSNGHFTDDFDSGLATLMAEPWARKAVRLVIALGDVSDIAPLQRFIGEPKSNKDPRPLLASNPEQLTRYIRWVTGDVVDAVSKQHTPIVGGMQVTANVILPAPPVNNQTKSEAAVTDWNSSLGNNQTQRDTGWHYLYSSVCGAAHTLQGKDNCDAVECLKPTDDVLLNVVALADGHGSSRCFRSGQGAKLAVTALCSLAKEGLFGRTNLQVPEAPEDRKKLLGAIVSRWRQLVDEHVKAVPWSDAERAEHNIQPTNDASDQSVGVDYTIYGTTLIGAIADDSNVLILQLGDGDILLVDAEGRVREPMERDPQLIANHVTSMCLADAVHQFRVCLIPVSADDPNLILLSTDGYSNSFELWEGFTQVATDLVQMLSDRGTDYIDTNLESWLTRTSTVGSGDDISVCLFYRNIHRRADILVEVQPTPFQDEDEKELCGQTYTQVTAAITPDD